MASVESIEEVIIKSKKRVQNHGEVFTPQWIIDKMLDTPGVKEACENIEATFLEPSAGEGAFLVAILSRKLEMVSSRYNDSLKQYEHYSLFALTTLYGVELLKDNVRTCHWNLLKVYLDYYNRAWDKHKIKKGKSYSLNHEKVLESAKVIVYANIQQGNFLTRRTADGGPIVFSEWNALTQLGKNKTIKVIRTEYTLDEIQHEMIKLPGEKFGKRKIGKMIPLPLYNSPSTDESEEEILNYLPCMIKHVYKQS